MAIDPLTATLTAGTVVGNLLQGREAKQNSKAALAQQLRMHYDAMRLAKAKRTDAFGNEVFYNEETGEWVTNLSPMQKALIKAQEREQFVGLTEDAARNRQARRRQAAIGESSAEDYNRELAGYRYEPRKSEDQIYGEISQLLSRSRQGESGAVTRQNLRHGQPLVRASNASAGPDPAQQALMARKAALDEFIQRESGRNQRFLPSLGFFREGAGGGAGAPINFGNQNAQLGSTQDAMAKLIASVGQSGADNIAKANQDVTKAIGSQFPSMSDSARMIAALRGVPSRAPLSKRPSTSIQTSPDFPYEWELGQ